jgi:hypothetical protein
MFILITSLRSDLPNKNWLDIFCLPTLWVVAIVEHLKRSGISGRIGRGDEFRQSSRIINRGDNKSTQEKRWQKISIKWL